MSADPQQLKKVSEFGTPGILFCVDRQPSTSRLVVGSSDFQVYDFDIHDEKPAPAALEGRHESYVTGIAHLGETIVSCSYDGSLIWWDVATRKPIRTVAAHDRWIRRVIATPDARHILSVADDMHCKLWDAQSGELLATLDDHKAETPHHYPSMLYAVTVSPDGTLIATGDKVGHVAIWNRDSGQKVGEVEAPGMYTWDPRQRRHSIGGIRSVAFSHDSQMLAVGGIGKIGNIDHLGGPSRLELFDWRAAKVVTTIENNELKGLIEQMAFAPDDSWICGVGGDHQGFVNFYDVAEGKIIKQEKAPMHIHGFARSDDFERLYVVGHGKMQVWELAADSPEPAAEEPAQEAADR